MPDDPPASELPPRSTGTPLPLLLKKLLIWGLFFGAVYLAADFFFTAFMTFMFSYLVLAVVGWIMKRLSPRHERPWLRRGLTAGVFLLIPVVLFASLGMIASRLVSQAQRIVGWVGNLDPESESTRLLEPAVGPLLFKEEYGGPNDERYQKALAEFRATGPRHVAEYYDFPSLVAWVEGSFDKKFTEEERNRIRTRLTQEGTGSDAFADWFLQKKLPQLQRQAAEAGSGGPLDPLARDAAVTTPQQLLEQVRRDPFAQARLRLDWLNDQLAEDLAKARKSPVYEQEFRKYYEDLHTQQPDTVPYTYDEYLQLRSVRPQGLKAFGATLAKLRPSHAAGDDPATLRSDFETATRHELFQKWWNTNPSARFIRQHVEDRLAALSGDGAVWLERVARALVNIPLELATALLLSFFICIDFPKLRSAGRRLRETWLRDFYDEIVPALTRLAHLIGRSMHAQGLIALCNAFLMFVALSVLGIEHEVLLSLLVFILCLVPVAGITVSWVLVAFVALIQPGGGFALALKASVAVLVVLLLEMFVFSPRILGKMMELHPVLIIALLPLAQYFFGIWGVILATPVAVYVSYTLIFGKQIPGIDIQPEAPVEAAPKA